MFDEITDQEMAFAIAAQEFNGESTIEIITDVSELFG
jgi:hypothetical protein